MKYPVKKIIATLLSFVVSMQPVFSASATYTHRQYVQDLKVTGSSTNPTDPVDPSNPGDTSNLVLSTDTLAFSPQDVGTEANLQLLVTNQGAATPLNIQTGVAVFAATHNCPTTLNTGESCTISVRFAPNAGLNYSELLSIQPLTGSAKKVTLTGQGLGAVLAVNPKKLSFEETFVGANLVKALTVTNTGNKVAVLGSPTFESTTRYVVTENYCQSALDVGQSCNMSVKFTPTSAGTVEDIMTLVANTGAGNTRATVSLIGYGVESGLNVPKSSDFDRVELGTTKVKGLSILNRGVTTLTISSITVSDPDFKATGCSAPMPPGSSCTLPVEFTPTRAAGYAATLTIAQGDTTHTVNLTGIGSQTATASVTPDTLEFGSVTVGVATQSQSVTLKNTSNALLKYTKFSAPEGYTAETDCTEYLSPGQSCNFNITALAVQNGQMNRNFSITTNAGSQPVMLRAQASGGATDLLLSATELDFGSVDALSSSETKTVLVKNTSTVVSNIKGIKSSAMFATTTSCGAALGPDEQCAVSVTFNPLLAKLYSNTVTINTDTGASAISVQGSGVAPQLRISPDYVDFGDIAGLAKVDPILVSVKSKGGKPVNISGINLTNAAFSQTNNCPATLENDTSCFISVSVAPGTEGAITGQLSVSSNSLEPNSPITVTSANKTYVAQITTTNTDFGSVTSSTAGPALLDVTVKNVGVANMTLSGISPINEFVSLKSSNCTAIAPQASCTLSLALSRTKPTTLNKTFKTSGPGANAEFTVTGLVSGVSARWVKPAIDFGYVEKGASAQQTVTLTNKGNISANLSGIQLSSNAFTVNASSCTNVPALGACSVTIGFAPTASGSFSANVTGISTVSPLAWEGEQLSITGSSVLTRLSSSTTNLDMGVIKQGQTSDTKTIVLLNDGDVSLSNISITSPVGVTVTTDCPTTLAVGSSCNASVSVNSVTLNKPEGAFTSNLSIRASSVTTTVAVSGYITQDLTIKASNSANSVSNVTLDFGRVDLGTQKSINVYVVPRGTSGKVVASAAITGSNASEFTWKKVAKIVPTGSVESSCGAQISGSSFSNCSADVFTNGQYATTASALSLTLNMTAANPTGARNASLTLVYNDGTQEVIPITAVVPSLAKASFSTDNLQFSPTDVNTDENTKSVLTIRLMNTGAEPLIITSAPEISGSSTFSFAPTGGTTCSGSIAVGAYCDTTVYFKPIDNSTSTGTLTFATSDYTSPAVIPMSGTGLQGVGALVVDGGGSPDFGGVDLGTISKKVFLFTNTGNKAITDVYPVLSGAPASVTMLPAESTCGTESLKVSVGGAQSCTITLAYNANTSGEVLSGVTLTVNSTAKNNPVSTSINGFAKGTWAVSVTDNADTPLSVYNFGAVNAGSNVTYVVKIKNTGTAPLALSSAPAISGDAAFTVTTSCTSTLAVSASCSATVKFAPTAAPEVSADLNITTSAGSSKVSFKGTGNVPAASLGANTSYDFGTVYVTQSATRTFTLTNTGNVNLSNLTSAITNASVTVQSTTCATLTPTAQCSIVLKYAPTASGSIAAGDVKFKMTAFSIDDVTITPANTITGTAQSATGSLSPSTSNAFGNVRVGDTATLNYTFSNTGQAGLTGVYASVTGAAQGLTLTNNNCGTSSATITLAAGQSCTYTVRWIPNATGALSSQSTQVTSSAVNSPSNFALTGTGTQAAGTLTPSPDTAFGAVAIGATRSKVVTYTNTGTAATNNSYISFATTSGDGVTISANTCGTSASPVSIAVGGSCSANINYAPATATTLSGTLSLYKGASTTQSLTFSGNGFSVNAMASDANWGVSNGTITKTTTVWAGSGGVLPRSGGKWYWEVTIGNLPNCSSPGCDGVGVSGYPDLYYPGSTTTTGRPGTLLERGSASGIYVGSSKVVAASAYTSGSTIGIAANLDTRNITFYNTATCASIGTVTIGVSTSYVPLVAAYYATTSFSMNFGTSAFKCAPPAGYTAGF